MKKVIFILVFFIGICSVYAGDSIYSLTLGAGLRNINGVEDEQGKNIFEEVYGTNNLTYSFDFGYKFAKYFQAFLHSEFFTAKGELTFTKEETTLTIIPVELGCRAMYGLYRGMFYPYIGAGAGFYIYTEENVIGDVKDQQFGFFGELGLNYYFIKSAFLDLKIKYIILKVGEDPEKIDLGGLALTAGIGYSF